MNGLNVTRYLHKDHKNYFNEIDKKSITLAGLSMDIIYINRDST